MNCFYLTFTVLIIGANAGVLNWDKHDHLLLGNQTDLQQDYPQEVVANRTAEGSGMGLGEEHYQPVTEKIEKCENGWLRFENSCYFVERKESATFNEAKHVCEKKNGKLFTPNSEEEYKTVMANTAVYSYTWSGIQKKTENGDAIWASETEFDYKKMNWLVKPFSSISNGYNSVSRCTAFYNGNIETAKYNYFYPCDWKFYFICEKNSVVQIVSNNV